MIHRTPRRLLFASLITLAPLLCPASASAAILPTAPPIPHGTLAQRAQCAFGFYVFLLLTYVFGRLTGARAKIRIRTLTWGILLQFIFGAIVVWNRAFLVAITEAVNALLGFAYQGAHIVFGDLSNQTGAVVTNPAGDLLGYAHNVAFFVMPTIVFLSCLTAIAYHSGIMQIVVQALAWVMAKSMGCSGAETLCTAANIFVGQAEAPLMIKPFVAVATQSELMAMMVIGFANIASGVLGLYTIWLSPFIPDAAGHLAAACFIAAPGSLLISKLLIPETEQAVTSAGVEFKIDRLDANLVDAAARGTSEGLALALNVVAMLISFTAIVALVDALLGWVGLKIHVGTAA